MLRTLRNYIAYHHLVAYSFVTTALALYLVAAAAAGLDEGLSTHEGATQEETCNEDPSHH